MRKHANPQVTLKPQDLLVLMKLCVAAGDDDLSFRKLADQTGVAKSEVHAAVLRLEAANLVIRANDGLVPIRDAVREFILHGARGAIRVRARTRPDIPRGAHVVGSGAAEPDNQPEPGIAARLAGSERDREGAGAAPAIPHGSRSRTP